jgi:hypothetical protein
MMAWGTSVMGDDRVVSLSTSATDFVSRKTPRNPGPFSSPCGSRLSSHEEDDCRLCVAQYAPRPAPPAPAGSQTDRTPLHIAQIPVDNNTGCEYRHGYPGLWSGGGSPASHGSPGAR